ncbi:MAG: peroxidase-related enzyme [Saprospiraceae bacterium]|nr:peroxidase-related enzyme [Saprospiraceae bacterium]
MPYNKLNNELPGIRALMEFRPETAIPLNALAELLLRDDDNTLTRGERELIATYVSYLNDCFFCQNAHGALAQYYLQCDMDFIDKVKENYLNMPLGQKIKALLSIAESVTKGGKEVSRDQITIAKNEGASDREIHDTVLIAAFFNMCNRYVDGLNTLAVPNRQYYIERAEMRAKEGYAHFDLYK